MRALDLFCGAGGATKGLQLAGFHVTGVDIVAQPHYCGDKFIQGDAMEYPTEGFDFIWASPPCQAYTVAGLSHRMGGKKYVDLVDLMRDRLEASGTPYVIENVVKSPVRPDLVLCGSMFDLRLVRHRWFEIGFDWFGLVPKCQHHPDPVTVCGHGTPNWIRERRGGVAFKQQEKRDAMGIDWMNRGELAQSIPPAYSQFIAEKFLESRVTDLPPEAPNCSEVTSVAASRKSKEEDD